MRVITVVTPMDLRLGATCRRKLDGAMHVCSDLIHGAMHAALGDRARCVMHCHAPYATTLCALDPVNCADAEWPLQQLHQVASKWHGEVSLN